jgi:hypothetical protein
MNDNFEVGSVNIEENALNQPPYVLPPGIDRQVLSGNAGAQRQNEASFIYEGKTCGRKQEGYLRIQAWI